MRLPARLQSATGSGIKIVDFCYFLDADSPSRNDLSAVHLASMSELDDFHRQHVGEH